MIPLVVTYCNKFKETNYENTRRFVETLQNNDWDYAVLGDGETWENYMTKVSAYRRHLETLSPEQVVIISDAYDVLQKYNSRLAVQLPNHKYNYVAFKHYHETEKKVK
jgi:hypothetical protein